MMICLTSCSDDYLERAPLVELSDANFWKTTNDLKIYVNNFYNQEGLLSRFYVHWYESPYTFDAIDGSDTYIMADYNGRLNGENTLPSSGGGWSSSDWSLLRNINYFMDHYQQVDGAWDVVKQYVGEALFFRSIFYFKKLVTFGDVPWVSTTLYQNSPELFDPRMPRNQVTDSILYDLDLAIDYLPARAAGGWTGRVTKETALALQARVALYEGTWERYHAKKNTPFKVNGSDGTKFIQKAADAAGNLMQLADENGFPALANTGVDYGYWLLFNQKDYSNNKEVLLWRKYSLAEEQVQHWVVGHAYGMGITKTMIESYLCTDGKPIAVSPLYQGDKDLRTVVANRDPRLNQTIQVNDSVHIVYNEPNLTYFTEPRFGVSTQTSVTGYQRYKGHTADYQEIYVSNEQSTSGAIYFRYGETLLIYAEAKAELGTITQADIDITVNALRKRAGMPAMLDINNITPDPNWDFTGISPLLQEIRRERKVEMACENMRLNDIFRWAAADEVIVGKRPLGALRKQWEIPDEETGEIPERIATLPINAQGYIDCYKNSPALDNGYRFNVNRDYLMPIPTEQLVLNPALLQNPGW
ncbi:MAG: RagB/SusD family nutrient uptake outer membrane protein [Dysgonamonadaceae bacterium]|nr:RagB/SusD family nutrient uptake outer membrane protein [Dysgonamonadaceae bacterium]